MAPTPKLERLRERSGRSAPRVRCRTWPESPQLPLEASHLESLSDLDSTSRSSSWARQTSSEPCANESSCVRTRRRSLPSSERVWEHQPHPATTRSHNPSGTAGCRNLRRGSAAFSLAANKWRIAGNKRRPSHPSNIPAPPSKMKTVMIWTSQRSGRAGSVRRSSKGSFRAH